VTVLPKVVSGDTGMRIVLPGDAGYDDVIDGKLPAGVESGTMVDDREIAH